MGEYHQLYVQSDTLLLPDVFENFQNMYIEIYELGLANFICASGLAWQAALKKTRVKLVILTDINILLMVEKGARWGICIYNRKIDIQQLIINEWKIMTKIMNRHIFNIRITKNCNEESNKGYFLELDFQEPELQTFSMIYHFYLTK